MSAFDPDRSRWNLRDMMATAANEIAPVAADTDDEPVAPCLYCGRVMRVCACIPGERAILDDEDTQVIDVEFEAA